MAISGPGAGYVGREAELERLARRLERAADGAGGLLVLRGPAGMGTTRTAHEAAARADRLGMVTLWGSTPEGLAGRPFGPIAEALEEFGTSIPASLLRAQLGAGAPALSRMCPRLRDVLPDIAPAAPLEAADERLRLYDAVVGWLRRASAEGPILLVLDDIQWADADTSALLGHVASAAPTMRLLVLATVAWPAAGGVAGTAVLESADVIDLPGLDDGAIGVILGALGDRPLPSAASGLIGAVSGGHPLFARELYRHLVEEDRLATDRLPAASELPSTLEATVSWRVSRLPADTRNALATLACFPLGAAPALLAQVSGLSRARLVEVVERAVAADIVRLSEHGLRYSIYHDRIRRALLAATPVRVRSAVHRRIAETLEGEFGDEVRAHAAELVDHLVQALAAEPSTAADARAVRHLLVAAEQARTSGAYRRAATCLAHAVRWFGEGQRTDYVDLVARRAAAEAEAGEFAAAVRSLTDLLAGQRRHGSLTRESWDDAVSAIRTLRHGGAIAQAAGLARMGLDEGAPRDELLRTRLRLLAEEWVVADAAGLSRLAWRVDERDPASMLTERGDEADLADIFLAQRPRAAADSVQLVARVAAWHRPTAVLSGMRGATIDLLTRFGQFREAAMMAGRYLAHAERFGSLRDVAAALLLLSRARAMTGDLGPAAEIIAAADGVLARIPEPGELEVDRLLAELTLAHYRDADWPKLAERISTMRTAEPRPAGLLLAAEEAVADARGGREPDARPLIAGLLEALADVPPLAFARDGALFSALTAAWEIGAAEHALAGRTLVERAGGAGAGGSQAATPRLALARLAGLAGNVASARELFTEERPRLEAAGLRPLRAILDHDEAITIAAGGTGFGEAGALLERAIAQFDALGMTGWADRARWLQAAGFESALQPGGRLHFSYPAGLSRREADVVRLLAGGWTTDEAAAQLDVDGSVFDRHLASALEKLGAANLDELPRYARRHGLGGV